MDYQSDLEEHEGVFYRVQIVNIETGEVNSIRSEYFSLEQARNAAARLWKQAMRFWAWENVSIQVLKYQAPTVLGEVNGPDGYEGWNLATDSTFMKRRQRNRLR